jgi:hypothetical protein
VVEGQACERGFFVGWAPWPEPEKREMTILMEFFHHTRFVGIYPTDKYGVNLIYLFYALKLGPKKKIFYF